MEGIQQLQSYSPGVESGVIRATGATGDLRLHQFRSRTFRNIRYVRVWLPPGYDDAENSGRRYPVLYLNDGQNLFESSSSFTGVEWGVDETTDRLIREGVVPPVIVVGLDNAGRARLREYMPHRSLHPMMLRVSGNRYPRFLIKEVMPFMARTYRVATGPENTGLGGSSLGALIALYTAMLHPEVIGRLLLESPSLWASNRQIIRDAHDVRRWPQRVYLAMGTAEAGREERNRSMVDDTRELNGIVRRAGLDDSRVKMVIEDGGTHHESAWARRFPEALAFLFGQR
jgi:predicted alpha/beta superfamily hydrolase